MECGLKASIASAFAKYHMPDKALVEKSHTHKFEELVGLANLKAPLAAQIAADPDFAANWRTVMDWKESSRYWVQSEQEATDLVDAVRDPNHGVLPWIMTSW